MIKQIMKILAVFSFLLVLSTTANAQDPAFSQFYANPVYLNPAFAGAISNGCNRVSLNYRDQWPGIGRTFVTSTASYDTRIGQSGLSGRFLNDRSGSGSLALNTFSVAYAYHLQVNRKFNINFSLEPAIRTISLDWSKLTFGDQIDPKYGFIYPTQEDIDNNATGVGFFDINAGILGYGEYWYVGFAAHHLTQPNQGFISESQLPRKYTIHMGGNIPLSRYRNSVTTISPNFLYQKQKEFQQFNYGVYVNKGPIVGGLWARHSVKNVDSFILMVGLIQDAFKFGYSYDITLSNLKNSNTLGAHELSFTLFMPCRNRSKSFNTISCPSF
ncbi:MAG TPA: type IX secretion system membrane protein PorP/SprF [Flavobacteriales bacterium]|nr:type IX secretion system membrane protein PorP/SprF [Flavobacteriales bacterium]